MLKSLDLPLSLETFNKEDILFLVLLGQKIFVSGHQTQKRPIFISAIFLFPFTHPQGHTSPSALMDAKE